MSDDQFDPERAKESTLSALHVAVVTLGANAEHLVQPIVERMGAPSEAHAIGLIRMAGEVLLMLAADIESTDVADVKDADQLVAQAQQKAAGKTH